MHRFRQIAASAVVGAALAVTGAGCSSSDRPDSVPMTAQEFGSGREEATFNVTQDGTVYIVDGTRKDLVYTGNVKKGDYVKVDAKENEVTVNNRKVTESDLLNDHKYRIYFEPSREQTSATAPPPQTIIQTNPNARTTVTTDPNAAQPAAGTVIQADPNSKTTVTTDPNAPHSTTITPAPAQPRTSVTTDPNTGRTTVTTDPNAVTTPEKEKTTITTDPNTGQTTIKQQP